MAEVEESKQKLEAIRRIREEKKFAAKVQKKVSFSISCFTIEIIDGAHNLVMVFFVPYSEVHCSLLNVNSGNGKETE